MTRGRKRANGEGTIYKRSDGRYEAQISIGNGKRKSFFGKTRAEASAKLTAALNDARRGMPIVSERQTVAQYLSHWLEIRKPPTLERSTWIRYEINVRVHLVPRLGHIALARLTPQQVAQMCAEELETRLSPTTVNQMHAVLHDALQDALRMGLVPRNVADMVRPPRKAKNEMRVWNPDEVRTFLAAAKGDRFEALYLLAISTGMRQGEILGLRWRDVDLESGVVQVQVTLKRAQGISIGKPKTPQSRRKIALTPQAVEALRQHRTRQLEERLQLGSAWEDNDLIFPNAVGKPMDSGNLQRRSFAALIKRAGVPKIRLHDLRHTAATLLLLQGVHPKVVSEILGHTSVTITLTLYSHVLPDMQRDATAAMCRILEG